MAGTILLAGALLAQSASLVVSGEEQSARSGDRVDVGYTELVQGRPHDAIARIRANREVEAGDPAALINLGAAYARIGNTKKAEASYVAAIASSHRYDLELADGRWMDSRRAARLALRGLASGQVLALR